MAALPYVVKAFVGPAGGVLVDWLIKNKMSVRNTRRCVFTVGKRKLHCALICYNAKLTSELQAKSDQARDCWLKLDS